MGESMHEKTKTDAAGVACGVAGEGLTCAVVSWVMPLVAVVALVIGLY